MRNECKSEKNSKGGERLMMGCGNWGNWGGMFGSGFGFGWIFTIIIWALIIWAIISFFKAANRGRDGERWGSREGREEKEDAALRILRERFARGEITREEFEQKRKDMENMK
ncbi:MAG: hypothetical protein ACD_9C00262G0004 [uncultured bacterium]|nr:MAG: hypothetical protein ACD_9C00262G0004 [uncultured bacterium]